MWSDPWIQEAEESSRVLEEIETKLRDRTPTQTLIESSGWKLLELGPKLDRLESLLHNPPAKPNLTEQDKEYRREMLLGIQRRMKSVAMDIYSAQHRNSRESLTSTFTEDITKTASYRDYDYESTTTDSKQNQSLATPLVNADDATTSPSQRSGTSSLDFREWIWKACQVLLIVLGTGALLVILFIVVALI